MSELFATFGVNWKLLAMQAVNFGVLLFVLWYFLYRPILNMIDERREKIAEGVREAEEAAVRLKDAHGEGRDIVAKAARESEAMVAAARGRADEKGAEILKTAEERAASLLADAAARAEEEGRRALKASEKEIARAAMLAAEKLLREKSA